MNATATTGILGRIANASSSLIAMGVKALGKATGCPSSDGPKLVSASPIDSERIRLRMLHAEGRFEEIAQIAETAEELQIVRAAMRELATAEQDVKPILLRLGAGTSACALNALIVLIDKDEVRKAYELFGEKVRSGQIVQMINDGAARFFLVVDLACFFDHVFKTSQATGLFSAMIHMLPPGKQVHALCEIFGDPEPGGFRYKHDQNGITGEIKLLALDILMQLPPAVRQRALWYATRERHEVVAYNASVALIEYWKNEGKVPVQLEPFRMLDVGMLFYLSQIASAFRWKTRASLLELHEQEQHWQEELAGLPENSRGARAIEQRLEELQKELRRETDARLNSLQPLVNEITKCLELPFAVLQASDEIDCAAYAVGTGTVLINRVTIFDERPLGEDVMSSLLHELLHMEQDSMIIRMICDDLNLRFGAHGKLLKDVWARYSDLIGYAPDHLFLLGVLRTRNDRKLTPAERKRAERLVVARAQSFQNNYQSKAVSARMKHLTASRAALASGQYDTHLLGCLRDLKQLEGMFEAGKIPEVLLYELKNCKDGVERVATECVKKGMAQPSRDLIAVAEQLMESENRLFFEFFVLRIRQLLVETLEEELNGLSMLVSRIMRTGYHEDEAYTISDRSEVIVKAILKGWYATPAASA